MGLNVLGYKFHLLRNVAILPVDTNDFTFSPRLSPNDFLSRCKFSTLKTRQPMVEFYLTHVLALSATEEARKYKICFLQESNSRHPHYC